MVANLAESEEPSQPEQILHANVSGSGAPVVLLHGLFGMGSNLGALARSLADRYEVHQLDLPNHGRSAWTARMSFSALADHVAAYMRGVIVGPAHLFGHSLGGKVAMQLALDEPDLVASLTVADIAPVAYAPTHDAVFRGIAEVSTRGPASRAEAGELLRRSLSEEGVVQFLLLGLKREPDGTYGWRFNAQALRDNYAALREALPAGRYGGPALFIYGELSAYMNDAGMAAARERFPGATFECLAGTGHWLHAEKPEAFNALVGGFLDAQGREARP